MHWSDEAIVLSVRSHGETSAIAELFTQRHGRHLGLVRGGRSRRMRPVLQPGNLVTADWRARLSEHLGSFSVEMLEPHAARVMSDRMALAGLDTLTMLARLLPERDPHEGLYEGSLIVLGAMARDEHWPALLVRWELALLDDLGFGLDLRSCAATGETSGLAYVSPKSGKAVSRAAAEPYLEKMLALPPFLSQSGAEVPAPHQDEIIDGFALTTFFFDRHVWAPRGLKPPASRARLLAMMQA